MKTYTVTFEDNKCGRGNRALPFEVAVRDVREVPEAVYRKARTFLASRGVDYTAQYAEDGSSASGEIYAGFHTVGKWSAVAKPASEYEAHMSKSVNDFPCPRCKAGAGRPCMTPAGHEANEPHAARVTRFWKIAAQTKHVTEVAKP